MGGDLVVILGFLAGGIAFAVVGTTGGFYALYGICRLISWLKRSDHYMNLMWLGMLILPFVGIGCFVGGGTFIATLVGRSSGKEKQRGFDVKANDPAERKG